MGYYYSLRGWLEASPDDFEAISNKIASIQKENADDSRYQLYAQGWSWNSDSINWTHYFFYGADVRKVGLDYLKDTLAKLAGLKLELYGFFHAQGEGGEKNYLITMKDDKVKVEDSEALYDTSLRKENHS